MQKNRKYKEYVIYDLNDNFVYAGTIKEIAEYLHRTQESIRSTLSHIKYKRNNREYIMVNGCRHKIFRLED